ncbi:hypothetical protein BJ912DRAFT_974179 [Pholiota molesta]|nr:hypothetical protein BJ912DRAFT_974179 [Pholiota molesta]
MSSQQLTYDDRDSAFQYTGGWFLDGTWSASNGQSGTLSGTNDPMAIPAVSFTYYGMKRSRGGLYGVCVDCNINNPSFTTIDAFDASDNGQNSPVALYSQSADKNEADSRGTPAGNSQLTVDRIVLDRSADIDIDIFTTTTTRDGTAPTSSSSPLSSSSATTSPRALVQRARRTLNYRAGSADWHTIRTNPSSSSFGVPLTANESGSPDSGKSSSSNLGTIIGAVVGSLAVIGLILMIVFCLRRRRRNKAATIDQSMAPSNPVPRSPPPMSTVEPFVVSSGTESSSPRHLEISTNSMGKRGSLHQRHLPSISQAGSSSVAQSSSPPPSTTQGREWDGGPLSLYTVDEDLPPKYSQLYSS